MGNIKNNFDPLVKALINPDNKLSLIPNWISFSRAICGIIIPIMVYSNVPLELLIGTISYAALSDFLDGKVARILVKKETKEGAMLDAISDKIFAILLMCFLTPVVNSLIINLALEGVISIINGKALSEGGKPKSNFIGKIKTWPLFISLGLIYLGISLNNLGIDSYLVSLGSIISLSSIPLELITIKGYIEDYKKIEPEIEDINEYVDINPEVKNEKQNTFGLSLDKEKNIQAVIFNCYENDNEMNLEKGKQKKLKL